MKKFKCFSTIVLISFAMFLVFSLTSCSKDNCEPKRPDVTGLVYVNAADYVAMQFSIHEGDILQSRLSSDRRGQFWASAADAINVNRDQRLASGFVIWITPEMYHAFKDRQDNGINLDPIRKPIIIM